MVKPKIAPARPKINRNTGIRLFDDQVEKIDKLTVEKYRGRMDRSGFVRAAIDEKLARIDQGLE
jgi:metal-responsive CopG/Arc/MetJ family transcriptional regulator